MSRQRPADRKPRRRKSDSTALFDSGDFLNEITREISRVALLQFRPLPILASQNLPAVGRAAFAFYRIIVVIGHRPIVREFFTGADVAHGDKCDLAADTEVRIA